MYNFLENEYKDRNKLTKHDLKKEQQQKVSVETNSLRISMFSYAIFMSNLRHISLFTSSNTQIYSQTDDSN